jgi:hypothetical protein
MAGDHWRCNRTSARANGGTYWTAYKSATQPPSSAAGQCLFRPGTASQGHGINYGNHQEDCGDAER